MKAGTELVPDFKCVEDPRAAPTWFERAYEDFLDYGAPRWSLMRLMRTVLKFEGPHKTIEGDGKPYIYGERMEAVFVRYLSLLISGFVPDPWSQVKVWTIFETQRDGRKVTNWFGCQNATKSGVMAALSVAFGVLHPEHTNQKVAEPFKTTGQKKVWRMVQRFCEQVKAQHRAELAEMKCIIKASPTSDEVRFGLYPDAGFLDLVAADEPGKLQGDKASDLEQKVGYLLAWLDEIALHPTQAFLDVLPNLTSNYNFHAVTGCNPELVPGNLDTELGKPTFGYRKLDLDHHFVWESAYGSRTYRFDGLRSPNFEHDRDVYPYLFGRKRLHYYEDAYGKGNPKYNAQVRGLSPSGMDGFFVTSLEKLEAGRVFKQFQWTEQDSHDIGYLDAGFGGDPAIFTHLRVGTGRDGGNTEGFEMCAAIEQFEIPIRSSVKIDEDWLEKIWQLKHDTGDLQKGEELSNMRQLAIESGLACQRRNIPLNLFGYDDSMRGMLIAEMTWALGTSPLAVSYVGKPEKRNIWPVRMTEDKDTRGREIRRPKRWDEECQKFVSQVWFQGAEILHSGLFRGGDIVRKAFDQAEQRRWTRTGMRRDIESKDDYKEKFNESPNESDSLFGALHVVVKKGLLKLTFDKAHPNKRQSSDSRLEKFWQPKKRETRGLALTGSKMN